MRLFGRGLRPRGGGRGRAGRPRRRPSRATRQRDARRQAAKTGTRNAAIQFAAGLMEERGLAMPSNATPLASDSKLGPGLRAALVAPTPPLLSALGATDGGRPAGHIKQMRGRSALALEASGPWNTGRPAVTSRGGSRPRASRSGGSRAFEKTRDVTCGDVQLGNETLVRGIWKRPANQRQRSQRAQPDEAPGAGSGRLRVRPAAEKARSDIADHPALDAEKLASEVGDNGGRLAMDDLRDAAADPVRRSACEALGLRLDMDSAKAERDEAAPRVPKDGNEFDAEGVLCLSSVCSPDAWDPRGHQPAGMEPFQWMACFCGGIGIGAWFPERIKPAYTKGLTTFKDLWMTKVLGLERLDEKENNKNRK
ncbi:unnamed protein product [Prorocentrum cordatum]|uniref:Uncharacterized protein n=1 Tax=Prorocentrum cordatum TaxID=2364126 RepID=A0ABN9TA39_9DINO|nr:unnamed protein product [Polarella glacialis]